MKIRRPDPSRIGQLEKSREAEVQQEIANFITAVTSYPDRFARDPYLSFEQHLFSVAAENQSMTGDRRR